MINWIKKTWTKLTNWFARRAPGLKVFTLSVLGALGSFGAVAQEYVSGLPLTTFVTAQQAMLVTGGLFTLVFIARALTNVFNKSNA